MASFIRSVTNWFLISVLMISIQLTARADGTDLINPFPITGAFQATHRHDLGSVSVIEFAGDYNKTISNEFNAEARAVVAKEYLRTHADNVDFIVVFSSFDFDTGNALAFHVGIQNQVQGIGLPQYDNSELFGSDGKLQGYIDMAALSRYIIDPLDPRFETVLSTLGHEVMHQWSGRVRFDQGNGLETALLGRNNAHWSNLLDSGASVLYGHRWRDNGDGTFTSVDIHKFFSPLDLYLAGLYGASEVAPLMLIVNPEQEPAYTPSESLLFNGPTINGTSRSISIDDIITAEGQRVPAVENAQKHFRFAFVYLVGETDTVTSANIGAIDMVRRGFMDRFAVWTGGRAIAQVYPEGLPEFEIDLPDEITGDDIRPGSVDLEAGFAWLRNQQTSEGYWQDKASTTLRDTVTSLDILSRLDSAFTGKDQAIAWLANETSENTDFLARQASILFGSVDDTQAANIVNALLSLQNKDGGWGIDKGFASNPLDTALVLQALAMQPNVSVEVINSASTYLLSVQNSDGGWSSHSGGPSRTSVTTTVLQTLKRLNKAANVQDAALTWLVVKQNADGGFGDSPSTNHDTANVLLTLADFEATDSIRLSDASAYLLNRQSDEGGWDGSTYTTALTLAALRKFSFPNWSVVSVAAQSTQVADGDKLPLAITLRNDSNLVSPENILSVFDGEPNAGGIQIGSDITVPELNPGSTITFRLIWDTLNHAGQHRIVAVVDPENTQVEMSELDNIGSVDITVEGVPQGIDLAIFDEDIVVIPKRPNTLPISLGFASMVRNLGSSDANSVRVQLRRDNAAGELVGEQIINIPARTTSAVNFSYLLTQAGLSNFVIVLDPDNTITEVRETNNTGLTSVETEASLDLVAGSIASDTASPLQGEDITFTVNLSNQGTHATPPSIVRYFITGSNGTTEIQSNTIQIDAGASIQQTVVWRVDQQGDLAFSVQMDPDNLIAEINETNNNASFSFTAGQANGPNLVVDFNDFIFDPNPGLEGGPLILSANIRNTGADDASDVEIAFYDGDPAVNGVLIGSDTISQLLSNDSIQVSVTWPSVPDALEKLLFVVVDPGDNITEFSEDDNVAFNTLSIQSLPDLIISSGNIILSPAFPSAGESVSITTKVFNSGNQPADNVIIRAFDGDPVSNGQQIGVDQIFDINGGSAIVANFSLTLPLENGVSSIYIQVDPDNSIIEQNELNNIAQRNFSVQDGNFYVTDRYISPNGDGIQDLTQFFFRLDETLDVEVTILDKRDEIVRRFSGDTLNNISSGNIIWNGLDDLGRVVLDGRYLLQVRHGNVVLGQSFVIVDTNRSSLLESIDTQFGFTSNLTCNVENYEFMLDAQDDSGFAYIGNGQNTPYGIYRLDTYGGNRRMILPIERVALSEFTTIPHIIGSDDLSKIAFPIGDGFDFIPSIFLLDGEGENLTELQPDLRISHDRSNIMLIDLDLDKQSVMFAVDNIYYEIDINTGVTRELFDANAIIGDSLDISHILSPDGQYLLVFTYADSNQLYIVNTQNGDYELIIDEPYQDNNASLNFSWSPDSSKFAVINAFGALISVYNTFGNVITEFEWPVLPDNNLTQDLNVLAPQWSNLSNEFALALHIETFDDGGGRGPVGKGVGPGGEKNSNEDSGGIYIVNLDTNTLSQIYSFPLVENNDQRRGPVGKNNFENEILPAPNFNTSNNFAWIPGERALIYIARDLDDTGLYTWLFELDTESLSTIFNDFTENGGFGNIHFTRTGRQWLFNASKEYYNPNTTCVTNNNDAWSFRSLLNLTADLRAIRSSLGGGILLSGTAVDANFNYYQLEYASSNAPNTWKSIQPSSGQMVVDEQFTLWVPPAPGSYFVRLTAIDLAGNLRRSVKRISWSDTSSITDLSRSPSIFSPNGDSIFDATTVQYRVLEPVHLEFNFYNEEGVLIQSISRDHTQVGSVFEFTWDGRDSNGLLVPNGIYTMEVLNYEFVITIDADAPDITLALQDAYQSIIPEGASHPVVNINPEISWSIDDPNYTDSIVHIAPANNPNNISEFIDLDPEETGEGTLNVERLLISQLTGQVFTLTAEDTAGNRSISSVGPVAEQLIISLAGIHKLNPRIVEYLEEHGLDIDQAHNLSPAIVNDLGGYFSQLSSVPYVPMPSVMGPALATRVNTNEVAFQIVETINPQLNGIYIQYRLDTDLSWHEIELSKFYSNEIIPNETLDFDILNHRLRAVLSVKDINVGSNTEYLVRLRAIDNNNIEHLSNIIRLEFNEDLLFRGLGRNASPSDYRNIILPLLKGRDIEQDEYVLWGQETIPELANIRFIVQSNDDPRYAIEQELGSVLSVQDAFILRTNDLVSCRKYSIYLIGEFDNRTITTGSREIETPCVELITKSEPVQVNSCNESPPGGAYIRFAPISLDRSELALLTLAPVDNPDDIIFNINKPTSVIREIKPEFQDFPYEFLLDTTLYEEGKQQFISRLSNVSGHEVSQLISVVIDRTPPELSITYPVEASNVCGIPRQLGNGDINNVLTLEGAIEDVNKMHYTLESSQGVFFNSLTSEKFHDSRSLNSFKEANGQNGIISERDYNLSNVNGSLGELFNRNGDYSVRLSAYDQGGHKQCLDRSFTFDGSVEVMDVSTDRILFSPNDDGETDQITIRYSTNETVILDSEIFAAQYNDQGQLEIVNNDVLRNLHSQVTIVEGLNSSTWDGKGNSGSVLADGLYAIALTFTDSCGNLIQRTLPVEIDNTPPGIAVSYPTISDPLPMIIEMQGSVSDAHLLNYHVEFGQSANPQTWVSLALKEENINNGILAIWNTFGLNGDYTVRITAIDKANNYQEHLIPLTLVERVKLISYFEAIEPLFSPNGDGRYENTSLRLGLDVDAIVTINITDINGVVRRALINAQNLLKGSTTYAWNGLDINDDLVEDGVYLAEISASLASNPVIQQHEAIRIVVDATAPSVDIVRPASGFVSGSGSIIGSINDTNLSHYEVSLASTPASPIWELLYEGTDNRTNANLGSLSNLPEGEYALRVQAVDQGDIRVERIIPFTIDNTPPEISFVEPQPNVFLGANANPLAVIATLEEQNPAQYELRYASNQNPAAFTTLVTGDSFPLAETLSLWDISSLADGQYLLQLSIKDKAGLSQVAQLNLNIDNTIPTAIISSPANNSYITHVTDIVGTAIDSNFSSYIIDLAPGAIGASTQFSELGAASQPVNGATLLNWQALPTDGLYTLRLRVIDKAENITETLLALTVDTTPPAAPSGLLAEFNNNSQVVNLTWNNNSDSDLAGYAVYRDGTRITSSLLQTTTFIDSNISEGRIKYTVTALDQAGLEGNQSDPVEVVVDTTAPITKIISPFNSATVNGIVEIKGTAFSPDDFKEYRLFIASSSSPNTSQLLRQSPVPMQADILGDWNTVGLAEGSSYIIRLESEDINQNTAINEVTVSVDNAPPAAPTGLIANATGANIQLNWTNNSEADLLGYLVFRNEQLTNGNGIVIGDLQPFAVSENNYLDISLADGDYSYTIIAIDRAGNLSDPSNIAEVTIDLRAPQALIIQPADQIEFEIPLYVLAVSADTDIADVQFQYKGVIDSTWIDLGIPDTELPYAIDFNPNNLNLSYGDYELRAIATDLNNQTDTAPQSITVTFTDLTAPAAVTDLSAIVNGADINLNWTNNNEADIAGYHIDRIDEQNVAQRLTAVPNTLNSYSDSGLDDGVYRYIVTAIDNSDNESQSSEEVEGIVYTPVLSSSVVNPTSATIIDLEGYGIHQATVNSSVTTNTGISDLPVVETNFDGQFILRNIPLTNGSNQIRIYLVDSSGNTSKSIQLNLMQGDIPSQPTGLDGLANNTDIALSWNNNPENNIIGYRIFRNDDPVLPDQTVTDTSAVSSADTIYTPASAVVDGSVATYWETLWPYNEQWIGINWAEPMLINSLYLHWRYNGNHPRNFEIEALYDGNWIRLLDVRNFESSGVEDTIALPVPYLITQVRIRPLEVEFFRVAEFRANAVSLIDINTFSETEPDGEHNYTVTAVNDFGFESIPSLPLLLEVGDITPPEAVSLNTVVSDSTVTLNWTESLASDLARYDIYRDNVLLTTITDLSSFSYDDLLLPNGTYEYTVRSVDAVGNENTSNIAVTTVLIQPPNSPINLAVSVINTGNALQLSWAADIGESPFAYRLFRSSTSGGPYEVLVDINDLQYVDLELVNGEDYFYVVAALDDLGNISTYSNEVNGVPNDLLAPLSPVLHSPTIAGQIYTTDQAAINIIGHGEPGAIIELSHNGFTVAQAIAQSEDELIQVNDIQTTGFLSPSAEYYVYEEFFDQPELHLYDFETGTQQTLVTAADFISLYPSWSIDGKQILFTDTDLSTFNNYIRSYSLIDGTITNLTDASNTSVFAGVLSPRSNMLAVLGYVDTGNISGEGIWLLNLNTGQWTLLKENYTYRFVESSLQWSPNGLSLAYIHTEPNRTVEFVNINTGVVQVVDNQASYLFTSVPHWSHDSKELLYVSRQSGNEQVWRYTVDTGIAQQITSGSDGHDVPQWLPDGKSVSYVNLSTNNLLVLNLQDASESLLIGSNVNIYDPITWTQSGYLSASVDFNLTRIKSAGHFEFPSIALELGDNNFSATAQDQAGNNSSASENIIISYNISDRADLVIPFDGIRVIPTIPEIGEQISIAVTVQNIGSQIAENAKLSLLIIDPQGNTETLFDNARLNNLAPGGVKIVNIAWSGGEIEGLYNIVAAIDPNNEVIEISESNNFKVHELAIVSEKLPTINVSSDSLTYGSNQSAIFTAVVSNGGDLFNGRLELNIVDSSGNLVEMVNTFDIFALAFGNAYQVEAEWNTDNIFAGSYQVIAQLLNNQDELIAEQSSAFAIGENSEFTTHISTDRTNYPSNTNVHISGVLNYSNGNTIVTGVETQLRILDANGLVLAEDSQSLGDLLPTTSSTVLLNWNTELHIAGQYHVELLVFSNEQTLLSEALNNFTISSDDIEISGQLALASDRLDAGAIQNVSYTVTNRGNLDITQLPILISLGNLNTQEILETRNIIVDITIGGSFQADISFNTNGLVLEPHSIILQALVLDINGNQQVATLDTLDFDLFDRELPSVRIVSPGNGQYINGAIESRIFAADNLSFIERVELSIDDGAWEAVGIQEINANLYGDTLPNLSEGSHSLQARAFDSAGNLGISDQILIEVDNQDPIISIAGVSNNLIIDQAVIPVVTISDSNLSSSFVSLNGNPFVSGTIVSAEGHYSLSVFAEDRAGNSSTQRVVFSIDNSAPKITITGVEEGEVNNSDITIDVEITDAHLTSHSITLNNQLFVSGTTISEEGSYQLSVSAEDFLGHISTQNINFAIDKTAPTLTIISPENNSQLSSANIDIIGESEANTIIFLEAEGMDRLSVFADAEGGFIFEQVVLKEGENEFSLNATDEAGNTGETSVLKITRLSDSQIDLSGSLVAINNTLVWLSGKDEDLQQLLIDSFVAKDFDYHIVYNQADFINQLRTRRYSKVMLVNSHKFSHHHHKHDNHHYCYDGDDDDRHHHNLHISYKVRSELRPMVASGLGLIAINNYSNHNKFIEDVLGAKIKGKLINIDQVLLEDSPASTAASLSLSTGKALRLQTSGGLAIGKLLPIDKPAMIVNSYIDGKTAILGFNPVDLQNRVAAIKIIQDLLGYVSPSQATNITGAINEIQWTASGFDSPITVKLNQNLSSDMKFINAKDGHIINDQQAEWSRNIQGNQSRFDAVIQLPSVKGDHMATVSLYKEQAGTLSFVAESELTIETTVDQIDIEDRLINKLNNYELTHFDKYKRYFALKMIKKAIAHDKDTKQGLDHSIRLLVKAYWWIEQMSLDLSEVKKELGNLLCSYQIKWSAIPKIDQAPKLIFIKPHTHHYIKGYATILWKDKDPDSNANISLYYDSDDHGEDGTLIKSDIEEDHDGYSGDSYKWNVSNLEKGTYYIYAVISDNTSSKTIYAPGSFTLKNRSGSRYNWHHRHNDMD